MNVRRTVPLILVVMLTACGGGLDPTTGDASSQKAAAPSVGGRGVPSDAPASTGAGPDSGFCSLLTDGEIEAATGYPVLSAESTDIGCVWMLDPGNGLPGLERVAVEIRSPGGQERFAFFESGGHEELPGVGDGALRQNSNTGGTVWALSGDRLFTFTFAFGVGTDDPIPLVLPLVESAISSE